MESKETKNAAYSCLRLISAVAVIVIHVSSALLDHQELYNFSQNETVFLLSLWSLSKWCVPCFILLTGALQLNSGKQYSLREYCKKYVRKALLALIVFGFPFAVIKEVFDAGGFSPQTLSNALIRFLTNTHFSHMWYVYFLVGLYLFLPLIKVFTDHCSAKTARYALWLLFVMNSVVPFASRVIGVSFAFSLPAESYALFYLLAGWYMARYKPGGTYGAFAAVLCIAVFSASAVYLCVTGNPLLEAFTDYGSPFIAIAAVCVFYLFQQLSITMTPPLWKLDRLCFGVYLIHPVFIQLLYRVSGFSPLGGLYPLKTALTVLAITMVSFLSSWLLSKIPLLNRLL